MKIILKYLIIFLFSSCMYLETKEFYRIKKIENGLLYKNNLGIADQIFLTKKFGEDNYYLGRVFLEVSVNEKENYISIYSDREKYRLNKTLLEFGDSYKKIEFLEDVYLHNHNEVKKITKEKLNSDNKINLKNIKEMKGEIVIEIGNVKINNQVYNISKIYIQKYRETESTSLLRQLLNEAGHRNGALYKKTEWIE